MLKEEVFNRVAKEYGTSIGVAKIFSLQPLDEVRDEFKDTSEYNGYKKTLTINYIITDSIDMGLYKELQRTIYDIRVNRKSKIKDELKLYKKAFKEITNEY
jgi:hypothetical protein